MAPWLQPERAWGGLSIRKGPRFQVGAPGADAVLREGPMLLLVLLRILVVVVVGGLIFGLRRHMTRP